MDGLPMTPCEYARERHRDIARWRNLWTILVFAFGSSVIIFLILAIFLFLQTSWLPGALSSLGTIVTGVSSSWVLKRRAESVEEENAAFDLVTKICGPKLSEEA